MNTEERRVQILSILQKETEPVAARKLAEQFGVSRQVIVQDMAVIRVKAPEIISTTRGYMLQKTGRKEGNMTIAEIQQEVLRMKKEQDVCILAHAYQGQEILEVADYMGDSYGLSVQASKSSCSGVIMCGVRFMAETCKILSPDKKVWLANPSAGCPMAEQLDIESLRALKAQCPDHTVVAYINTTSELKTECDVCVTSSSAVQICSRLDNDKILFIPDPNLGRYVAKQLPEKTFAFYKGGCPRHIVVSEKDVEKARAAHPEALLLVHPECRQEVVEKADYVGSTTGIMNFAKKSEKEEFIIGTENSIVEHLQFECPDKKFYPLAVQLTCMNMKITTLMDVYNCLKGRGGEEIKLSQNVMDGAGRCIRRMVELGG